MPAPSGRGRQKSTRPILEFLERGAQRKGKSIREITFEEFMNSPAMGFGGAGAIKSIRGVPGLRVQLPRNIPMEKDFPVAGTANREEILKTFDKQAIRAGNRANISRPNTIAGGELRKNVGGQRPPEAELEAAALFRQRAPRLERARIEAKKEFLKDETARAVSDPVKQKAIVSMRKKIFSLIGEKGIPPKELEKIRELIIKLRELEK